MRKRMSDLQAALRRAPVLGVVVLLAGVLGGVLGGRRVQHLIVPLKA